MFPQADESPIADPNIKKPKVTTNVGWKKMAIYIKNKNLDTDFIVESELKETWWKTDPEQFWTEAKNFQDKVFVFISRDPRVKTQAQIDEARRKTAFKVWKEAVQGLHPTAKAKEIAKLTFEEYLQREHNMQSNSRKQRRHADKLNKDEVKANGPRLEFFLKNAVQAYTDHMNNALAFHLEQGNTMPYKHIQVEYNIMQGFVPMDAIDPETPKEELEKLRITTNEEGVKGVEAAYIRMDKLLHLTDETIEKRRQEAASGVKIHPLTDLASGLHRQGLYSAMFPLTKDINFLAAKYRLLEDLFHHFIIKGLEKQELEVIEATRREENAKRSDIQERIKEVEEIFTVSKGGLNGQIQEEA